jgi:hypothetical protein
MAQLAALAAMAVLTTGCMGTWGLRSSYRSYVTAPFAEGSITVDEGATWLDGPGTGKGAFRWTVSTATFDPGTEQGSVQFRGAVRTKAHPAAGGHALELSIWNPRLEIDGDVGTLHADINHRPYSGTSPTTLPALQAAFDVPFATVDLSGASWAADANGNIQVLNAPMVGIPAAMALIGWDSFYGNPVALDPLTVTFNPSVQVPSLAAAPRVVVSQTSGLRAGDTISVWGTGFDPAAHTGTRPPLSGQPSGVYVVFGKFADTWKPSAGAPSSARQVIAQKWALPQASRQLLDPSGTGAAYVTIDQYGRFEATLTLAEHASTGAYGVYTFAGSGAVDATQELAVPIELQVG